MTEEVSKNDTEEGLSQKEEKKKKRSPNLKPFQDDRGRIKKGTNPNPTGRPKGTVSIVTEIRKLLKEPWEGDRSITVQQRLARVGINQAHIGDFKFWQEIMNRVDGKVPDVVEARLDKTWGIDFEEEEDGDSVDSPESTTPEASEEGEGQPEAT